MAEMSELQKRALSSVVMVALAGAAVYAGGPLFIAFVGAIAVIGGWEWARLKGVPDRGRRMAALMALTALPFLLLLLPGGSLAMAAAVALFAALAMLVASRLPRAAGMSGWLAFGILYTVLPALALIYLRTIGSTPQSGMLAVLSVLVCVSATDTAAYFGGRAIGGPKLAPRFSPSKTWAGLLCGMAASAIALPSFSLATGMPLPWWAGLPLGALVAVVAQAGDLFESHAKRQAGVKDSGRLIPGHGGVLDRVDGLLPAALLMALVFWAAHG